MPEISVAVGVSGLILTVGTILVGLGATLQRLRTLNDGQTVLFQKVEELQRDLKNGISKRISDHSGEIDVLKLGLAAAEKAAHADAQALREALLTTERNIERSCALRHGGTPSRA